MNDAIDDYAGLPALAVVPYKVTRWHPQCVPFGPLSLRYETKTVTELPQQQDNLKGITA